jgi:ribosome-associated protein
MIETTWRKQTIPHTVPTPPTSPDLLDLVERTLDGDKAHNVVVIDLKGKTEIADYLVVASGTSQRHVGAMANHLREEMKKVGVIPVPVEGVPQCDWVLVDGGDVVVHLFRPEVREFYNIEKMWGAVTSTPQDGVVVDTEVRP